MRRAATVNPDPCECVELCMLPDDGMWEMVVSTNSWRLSGVVVSSPSRMATPKEMKQSPEASADCKLTLVCITAPSLGEFLKVLRGKSSCPRAALETPFIWQANRKGCFRIRPYNEYEIRVRLIITLYHIAITRGEGQKPIFIHEEFRLVPVRNTAQSGLDQIRLDVSYR
jgi:hypothetical protein